LKLIADISALGYAPRWYLIGLTPAGMRKSIAEAVIDPLCKQKEVAALKLKRDNVVSVTVDGRDPVTLSQKVRDVINEVDNEIGGQQRTVTVTAVFAFAHRFSRRERAAAAARRIQGALLHDASRTDAAGRPGERPATHFVAGLGVVPPEVAAHVEGLGFVPHTVLQREDDQGVTHFVEGLGFVRPESAAFVLARRDEIQRARAARAVHEQRAADAPYEDTLESSRISWAQEQSEWSLLNVLEQNNFDHAVSISLADKQDLLRRYSTMLRDPLIVLPLENFLNTHSALFDSDKLAQLCNQSAADQRERLTVFWVYGKLVDAGVAASGITYAELAQACAFAMEGPGEQDSNCLLVEAVEDFELFTMLMTTTLTSQHLFGGGAAEPPSLAPDWDDPSQVKIRLPELPEAVSLLLLSSEWHDELERFFTETCVQFLKETPSSSSSTGEFPISEPQLSAFLQYSLLIDEMLEPLVEAGLLLLSDFIQSCELIRLAGNLIAHARGSAMLMDRDELRIQAVRALAVKCFTDFDALMRMEAQRRGFASVADETITRTEEALLEETPFFTHVENKNHGPDGCKEEVTLRKGRKGQLFATALDEAAFLRKDGQSHLAVAMGVHRMERAQAAAHS